MTTTVPGNSARGQNLLALKGHNQRVVAAEIRRSQMGVSRAEIAEATGLSPQGVGNIVRQLMRQGLVLEVGRSSSGGKPRTLLAMNPSGMYTVGVHLDPQQIEIVLFDLSGEIVERSVRPTPRSEEPDRVVEAIANRIARQLSGAGIDPTHVAGVGLAVLGPLDAQRENMIDPPLLPTWRNVPVRQMLEERVAVPVVMEKDVVAAALGELWLRQDPEPPSFVFIYLGTGAGMAVAQSGTVLRGRTGNAGEIGHLLSGRPAQVCPACHGTHIGLSLAPHEWVREAQTAGILPALADNASRRLLNDHALALVERAASGDLDARAVLEPVAFSLAQMAGVASDLLDLDEVVLGGPYWVGLSPWHRPTRDRGQPRHRRRVRQTRRGPFG